MRYPRRNQRSIPPKKDYAPTRSAQKPPGYTEIQAASELPPDSEAWAVFVRDVMQMPESYTPAVQEAIRQQRWKIAPNPLAAVRMAAYQEAKKAELR